MTHDETVDQAHTLLQNFVQVALAKLAQDWADRHLSLSQIRLLVALSHIGPANIGQLGKHMHTKQSATSLLVDSLVKAHLAERTDDPADRRRALVRLTPAGEMLLGKQRAGHQRMHAILNEMDDTHLTMFIETFKNIFALVENEGLFDEFADE